MAGARAEAVVGPSVAASQPRHPADRGHGPAGRPGSIAQQTCERHRSQPEAQNRCPTG